MKNNSNLEDNFYLLAIVYELNSMAEEWIIESSGTPSTYVQRAKGKIGAIVEVLTNEGMEFNPVEILEIDTNNTIGYGVECAGNLWTLLGIDNDLNLHKSLNFNNENLTIRTIQSSDLILKDSEKPSEYYLDMLKEIVNNSKKTSTTVADVTHLLINNGIKDYHFMTMPLWPKNMEPIKTWANELVTQRNKTNNSSLSFEIKKIQDEKHSERQLVKIKEFIELAEKELKQKIEQKSKHIEDYCTILETKEDQKLLGKVAQNRAVQELLKKGNSIKKMLSSFEHSESENYTIAFLSILDEPRLIKLNPEKNNPKDFLEILNYVTILEKIEQVVFEENYSHMEPAFKKFAPINSKALVNFGFTEEKYNAAIANENIWCGVSITSLSNLDFIHDLPKKMNEVRLLEQINSNSPNPLIGKRF